MKLSILNLQNNYNKVPLQGNSAVENPIKSTVPTQIGVQTSEPNIPSTASHTNETNTAEALKAATLAQAPMPYSYVGEIELPFSNNAKLYKMANGQKVAILQKKGPTVLKSYFNVGSMNENEKIKGISHFIEHMAFNGTTDGLKPGEFFKIVNDMGAMTNASTSFAQTDYFISSQLLDKNDWDTSVSIQSKMLQSPAHSAEMIEKEKGPVTSEISMVGDRPENTAINNCIKNLFQLKTDCPDLVAGSIANINALTRDDTLGYYNLWYTPDNCTTVVTGEVDDKTAMDTIAKYFNKYKSVPVENRRYQKFNPIQSPVRVDIKDTKANVSTITLGLCGPKNADAKENIKLELLIAAMMGYKGARLTKTLNKLQSGVSVNVERVGNRPDDPKAILFASQTTPAKTEAVIRTIYDEINKLAYNPLKKEELDIAKKYLQMAYSQISENSQMLNTLIGNALLDNNTDYVSNYLSILDSITPEEMSEFAKKYMDLNKASLSVVHPQTVDDASLLKNYQNINNTALQTPVSGIPHKASFKASFKGRLDEKAFDVKKIKQYKLANNMELTMNPNTSNIACSKIVLKTNIPANVKPALPAVLSVMLSEGSMSKVYDKFYEPIHKTGMDLGFDAGFSSITLTSQGLSQDIGLALDSMKEVLETPRFTEKTLDYAKKLIKESLMNTDSTAIDNAIETMFPNRPQGATAETALKTIDSITLAEIKGFYDYIIKNASAKATITAPTEKNPELEKVVLQKLSTGLMNFKPYEISHFPVYSDIKKDVVKTQVLNTKQADIAQCFKFKTNYNPKDHVTFALMNTILGDGPYSRLFNDLRETQKLAYLVESAIDYVGDSGIISLLIKTTTDDKQAGAISYSNVEKSLDGFKKHIEKLKTEKVTDEELKGAKLRLSNKLLSSIESSSAQTAILCDSKDSVLGVNAIAEKLKLIESITADDILNAANYIFANQSVKSVIASEDTLKNIDLTKYGEAV